LISTRFHNDKRFFTFSFYLFTWSEATMKKYKTPKIRSIALDNAQAMLQACAIGGAWFAMGLSFCVTSNGTTSGNNPANSACLSSVKGTINTTTIGTDKSDSQTMPS
jgi:hypothetical protein